MTKCYSPSDRRVCQHLKSELSYIESQLEVKQDHAKILRLAIKGAEIEEREQEEADDRA